MVKNKIALLFLLIGLLMGIPLGAYGYSQYSESQKPHIIEETLQTVQLKIPETFEEYKYCAGGVIDQSAKWDDDRLIVTAFDRCKMSRKAYKMEVYKDIIIPFIIAEYNIKSGGTLGAGVQYYRMLNRRVGFGGGIGGNRYSVMYQVGVVVAGNFL